MKSNRKITILFSTFLAFMLSGIYGFSQPTYDYTGRELNTITTAVPFLIISPDARAGALGDAGVSSAPDANSIHWNPAKYAFIKKDMGFAVSYSPWLRALVNDINLAYLSGYKKFGKDQAIAASLLYFSLGDITFTDIVGNTIGQFKPSEFAVDACYSRKLSDKFSGGISLRYIHSNLTGGYFVGGAESHPGNAVAADVSGYYESEFDMGQTPAKLGLGIDISNIGSKISYTETTERDFIPINLRLGPTVTFDIDDYNQIAVMLDINKLLVPTPPVYETDSDGLPVYDPNGDPIILAGKDPHVGVVTGMFQSFGDAPGGFKEELKEFSIATGVEYWYDKQFAIRAGFFYEDATKGNRKFFTLGAGLKYNVFGLDFAYLIPIEQRNPLENTLRFTLLFDFDAFKEQNNKTE
jgi:hypothetical protein